MAARPVISTTMALVQVKSPTISRIGALMRLSPQKSVSYSICCQLFTFVLLTSTQIAFATPTNRNPGVADDIPADIKQLLNDPALSGSITGIMVVDTKDGSVFYAKNENTRLIPASNRKLFTSAAALEVFPRLFLSLCG